jgi:hypothetical protein
MNPSLCAVGVVLGVGPCLLVSLYNCPLSDRGEEWTPPARLGFFSVWTQDSPQGGKDLLVT